jgi:hypothetical protein
MPERSELPSYRFGPLERRGLLLGMSSGQVGALASGGALALLALSVLSGVAGGALAALLLLGGVAAAFLPVGGRPLEAWTPLIIAYHLRRMGGRHRFRSSSHLRGHLVSIAGDGRLLEALPAEERPAGLEHLRVLEVEAEAGVAGVIKDPRQHTYTGVLRVRGRSFNVLDDAGQSEAARSWGAILASYALDSSAIARLQWIERTLPDDGNLVEAHFAERMAPDAPESSLRVYRQALAGGLHAGYRHECLLALRVDARRAWRQVRRAGGRNMDLGACALLMRELTAFAEQLEAAGIAVQDVLGPRGVAEVIRSSFEPEMRPRLRVIHGDGGNAGPHPRNAWPRETEEDWASFRAGRALHVTYHVREWPRIEVGPSFMAPLLLGARILRTVSMTMEPVPAGRAARELRRELTADASDDRIREKGGWMPSFRQQREGENVLRAEAELADGHASYRFSAYVTVSGSGADELETACSEVEQAASRAHIELERLHAQQALAFTYTLPLCEGLR